MKKLIGTILIILLTTICLFSETLTDDEILSYWSGLTKTERIDEIRTLDNIQNAEPTVIIPPITAILSGRDLYISYEATLAGRGGLLINIADELDYSVQMDDVTVENFIPSYIGRYLIVGGSCILAGLVGGLILSR